MKGPHERLKYDLRRLWECPHCKRRERTSGAVTSKLCMSAMAHPEGKPIPMKLIEDGVRRVGPAMATTCPPLDQQPPLDATSAPVEQPPTAT